MNYFFLYDPIGMRCINPMTRGFKDTVLNAMFTPAKTWQSLTNYNHSQTLVLCLYACEDLAAAHKP